MTTDLVNLDRVAVNTTQKRLAIENDLNACRIVHPTVIDTVILYPPPGTRLPNRMSLKVLARRFLERDIQMGGDRGHDSLEDAVATGDLVRVRVARQWREMQSKGWKFEKGELVGPAGVAGVNANPEKLMNGAAMVKKRTKTEAGLDGADERREIQWQTMAPYGRLQSAQVE